MKKIILPLIFSMQVISASASWDNPLVMCPEEILPKGLPCPDFTKAVNVYTDFPVGFSADDMKEWRANKAADLRYCRNLEVLRREKEAAGTYTPAIIESAWMVINGGERAKEKLEAIQAASLKYTIPPQVLMGAMKQESQLSVLGISPDGGNYSCGMAQLNIQEWCRGMNKLSENERVALDWPLDMSCDENIIPTNIIKPLYDIAVTKLGNRPQYRITSADFKGISAEQVISSFSKSTDAQQAKRFQAVNSFVSHCQDIGLSVAIKAQTLKGLFDNFVPKSLREAEQYKEGATFTRSCQSPYSSKYYPLHTGWLLAVAMYNAGPVQAKLIDHYFQVKGNDYPALNPLDLIEALHWGGKWKFGTDNISFKDRFGDKFSQKWFKSCIVQRHVAKVIQHVTLPVESIAKSLEQGGCSPTAPIPDYRKNSSGVK